MAKGRNLFGRIKKVTNRQGHLRETKTGKVTSVRPHTLRYFAKIKTSLTASPATFSFNSKDSRSAFLRGWRNNAKFRGKPVGEITTFSSKFTPTGTDVIS